MAVIKWNLHVLRQFTPACQLVRSNNRERCPLRPHIIPACWLLSLFGKQNARPEGPLIQSSTFIFLMCWCMLYTVNFKAHQYRKYLIPNHQQCGMPLHRNELKVKDAMAPTGTFSGTHQVFLRSGWGGALSIRASYWSLEI